MTYSSCGKGGFTLIELSIVLLIIGLLAGSIVIGREMIRQSQVMSIADDEVRYIAAANAFREKYAALPGDMANATNYWGTDPVGCPNSTYSSKALTTTCNGNGDGFISSDSLGATGTVTQFENFRAWQQLANGGFIAGSYTGVPGALSSSDTLPGLNTPLSRVPSGGFEWMEFNASSVYPASNWLNAAYYTQYLLFGGSMEAGSAGGKDLVSLNLTPTEAASIDTKIDDGLPGSGFVIATSTVAATNVLGCINTSSVPGYANGSNGIKVSRPACTLLFKVVW